MTMRPLLALALALVLTGCGAETSETPEAQADDPAPTADSTAEPSAGASAGNDVIALVSESDVGGEVDPQAVPLDTATAIADFSTRFEDERMAAAISEALVDTATLDGQTVLGAVVAVGCEPPTEVEVTSGPDGVEITAGLVKTDQQCLVPVTTVALVAVADED